MSFIAKPIGIVRSRLKKLKEAPRFYTEGAPNCVNQYQAQLSERAPPHDRGRWGGRSHLAAQGQRKVLRVRPRGVRTNPLTGVFSTRSPDRPAKNLFINKFQNAFSPLAIQIVDHHAGRQRSDPTWLKATEGRVKRKHAPKRL